MINFCSAILVIININNFFLHYTKQIIEIRLKLHVTSSKNYMEQIELNMLLFIFPIFLIKEILIILELKDKNKM